MTLSIGICGAHRTGKTTLAQALATLLEIPFMSTSTSQVFAQRGLDPAQPMDFAIRLSIQHDILDSAEAIWSRENGKFISDRTPIDMMAYTLADVQGTTEVEVQKLFQYWERCIQLTNQFFGQLCIVPPAIPLVFAVGKAALNPAYIQHIHYLVLGLSHDPHIHAQKIFLPKEVINLHDRVQFLSAVLV